MGLLRRGLGTLTNILAPPTNMPEVQDSASQECADSGIFCSEEAVAHRDAFVDLCVAFAPEKLKETRRKEAAREIEQLLLSGRFQAIAIRGGTLLAKTQVIRPVCAEKRYELGEYMIEITQQSFAAFNLTRTVSGYHSPHINDKGVFCITQGKAEIMHCINDGKLDSALYILERALWIVGAGVPFAEARIELWPSVEEDT